MRRRDRTGLAGDFSNLGHRRITKLLKREGWRVNGKKIHRLKKELALQLRNKTPKHMIRILAVIDTFGRFSPSPSTARYGPND